MNAIEAVGLRLHVMREQGFIPDAKAQNKDGAMAVNAACYAVLAAKGKRCVIRDVSSKESGWILSIDDRRDSLLKAAALLVAEIERLDVEVHTNAGLYEK